MSMSNEKTPTKTYTGGCHCGAVRFEADLDLAAGVTRCNCSICLKLGKAGILLKPSAFRLVRGEGDLSDYQWGSRIGHLLFCKHCGIHAFGRGHLEVLGGDFVSINALCLEGVEVLELPVGHWDGRHDNWMAGTRPTPWPVLG
jgi:hypothetical protein